MSRKSNNLIGVTGEYYVCAELGRRGILALITPKNNPLFDIVAVTPDARRTVTIQVKTMSIHNKQGWQLGKAICDTKNIDNLYTILVNLTPAGVEYYIYEYDILSARVKDMYDKYILIKKRDGGDRQDTDLRWWNISGFSEDDKRRKNNWEILGFSDVE